MTTVEERSTADRVGTLEPMASPTGVRAGLAEPPATRTRAACAG
ncbi:hypothetical protein ACFFWA_13365 [Actinomadura verrucosospora]